VQIIDGHVKSHENVLLLTMRAIFVMLITDIIKISLSSFEMTNN